MLHGAGDAGLGRAATPTTTAAHVPTPSLLAYPPTLHHTSRTGACRMVNRLRKKDTALVPRADELYRRWTGVGTN